MREKGDRKNARGRRKEEGERRKHESNRPNPPPPPKNAKRGISLEGYLGLQ
jgi:hypothetical protein